MHPASLSRMSFTINAENGDVISDRGTIQPSFHKMLIIYVTF